MANTFLFNCRQVSVSFQNIILAYDKLSKFPGSPTGTLGQAGLDFLSNTRLNFDTFHGGATSILFLFLNNCRKQIQQAESMRTLRKMTVSTVSPGPIANKTPHSKPSPVVGLASCMLFFLISFKVHSSS